MLTDIKEYIHAKGVVKFVFLIDDPDSDIWGGDTSDEVWALGAMRLRSKAIEGGRFQRRGKTDDCGPGTVGPKTGGE